MKKQIADLTNNRLQMLTNTSVKSVCPIMEQRANLAKLQNNEIRKAMANGKIKEQFQDGDYTYVHYDVHFSLYRVHGKRHYMEELVENRVATFFKGELFDDYEWLPEEEEVEGSISTNSEEERAPFIYDRRKAVQYAEQYWDKPNPAYKYFENNCTNYISQCLKAGGAPMRGNPNRGSGWWYTGSTWSWSWTVAHAFERYFANSKTGLRARRVSDASQLILGDIICYDFQGDGRFDHSTIVTAKDENGMPLVNANTFNSRMRYWAYEDSTAYTPNMKYRFYHILDDNSR